MNFRSTGSRKLTSEAPPEKISQMAESEISQVARACHDGLSSLAKESNHVQASLKDGLEQRDVQELIQRFEQWAGNLGVFQQSSSKLSLDYRLRDSPKVRAPILNMLADFKESTDLEIVSGHRPNRVMPTQMVISDADLEEFDISSSSSESGASSISGPDIERPHDQASELQKLISAMKTSLESLFRASVFIRKFAPKDRRQKASKTKPFDSSADIMYIRDKYPTLWGKEDRLATRLGEANARRRQYFRYRQQHHEKLSSEADDLVLTTKNTHLRTDSTTSGKHSRPGKPFLSDITRPSILAETEATEFQGNPLMNTQTSGLLSLEPAIFIEASRCPFCDDEWASVEPPPGRDAEDTVVLHVGNDEEFNSVGAVPDRNSQSDASFRSGRENLSRGWRILFDRWTTISAFSFFIGIHEAQKNGKISADSLATVDFESLPPSHKDEESDWTIIHNPTLPKMFDLELLHTTELDSSVVGVCFSPGGDYIAVCSNKRVQVFAVGTAEAVSILKSDDAIDITSEDSGYMYYRRACFHPEGKLLITGSDDKFVRVFDIDSQSVFKTLAGHERGVRSVYVSEDGKWIASGGNDCTVRLWSTVTWECHRVIETPAVVNVVSISPKSDFVAAGCYDNLARVWEIEPTVDPISGSEDTDAWTCAGHSDTVWSVQFSSDGKQVITTSSDMSIKLFAAVGQYEHSAGGGGGSPKSLRCLRTLIGHSVCRVPSPKYTLPMVCLEN
ncbi:regulator of conidiation-1 [Colletotrichum chrysophilum]|uniref:Regulator of conidiation-1 n=2 Tax=Colletotrichum chrysophilum TaxID=1836956 RepID=A0AAD9A3R6_9PEZI|nr:regulator of conidiation-1 [Colletotrichum chrysophilum]